MSQWQILPGDIWVSGNQSSSNRRQHVMDLINDGDPVKWYVRFQQVSVVAGLNREDSQLNQRPIPVHINTLSFQQA